MMRPRVPARPVATAAACLLLLVAPARATGDGEVGLELNKLEPRESACRAYVVVTNRTQSAFESLKLDLVMFDGEGVVARRVAVETAPLAAGKTSLKVFDVDATPCEGIGRVLLNGVLACRDASGKREDCGGLITTSSRARAELIK